MTSTPTLALPYIATAQAQKEVTHNDALNDIDMLLMPVILDRDLAAPPASPNDGDCYIVAAGASGAWSGHSGHLAAWYSGWKFKTPVAGWVVYIADEVIQVQFDGSAWTTVSSGGGGGGGSYGGNAAGTVSAPGMYYAADTDTGFCNSAADEITVATSGTARMAYFAGGTISIGDNTAPENNANIRISQAGHDAPALQVGTGINSVFMGSGLNYVSNGTAYIGFNAARTASNAWTYQGDGARNAGGIIDGRGDGGIRFYARASTGGSTATDSDSTTNNNMRMQIQPTFVTLCGTNGNEALRTLRTGSAVNRIEIAGNTTGNAPFVRAQGTDTNVDLCLQTQGTGVLSIALNTANLATTVGASGSAAALPANPVGYMRVKLNGTAYKIPYYND